jgi:hypothetical protein
LDPRDHPEVASFLRSLADGERDRFLAFAENEPSPYILWLYASAAGWEEGFAPLATWHEALFPRLDIPKKLREEARRLESDLAGVRGTDGSIYKNMGDRERSISALSKELRITLSAISSAQNGVDRRGLMAAGADQMAQALEGVFSGNAEALSAVKATFMHVVESISEAG